MTTADAFSLPYTITAVILALILVGSAQSKLTKQPRVVEGITGVGWPLERFPLLAWIEIAGAVGLVVGIWVPAVGIAAAAGVILYFAAAAIAHVRVRDVKGIPAPLVILAVAVVTLVLRLNSM